jgi:hypothetical protein
MFFTHLARLVAILVFVLGVFQVLLGIAIATGHLPPSALAAYSGASSTGELINRGTYAIAFAIGMGTLAEISFSVRKGPTGGSGSALGTGSGSST